MSHANCVFPPPSKGLPPVTVSVSTDRGSSRVRIMRVIMCGSDLWCNPDDSSPVVWDKIRPSDYPRIVRYVMPCGDMRILYERRV